MDRHSSEDEALIRACLLANQDPDLAAIEAAWDQIDDGIEEPWTEAPAE
jgi:hypothetical protein